MTVRPEPAPLLAAGGGLALLVSLLLDWYAPGISAFTAFEVLDLVLAALALAALAPGAAALAGSVAADLDLSPLARALPAVAGLALLIVVSQALNHPPAAVGEEARAGQWIALASALVLAGAAGLGERGSAAGADRSATTPMQAVRARDGARPRRQPDDGRPAGRPASAPAEARAAEPEVMDELYPDVERTGPIGGDDPEIARVEPRGEPPLSQP